ncbi:MAG: hypothetical protein EB127_18515 [Alphaproteobacteria bacterium]|jgi:hypothetical protein|nr:hypothetical protein [Alphaproteobacteria bacterium]
MGSIGETVSGWFTKLTGKTPQQVADQAKSALKIPAGLGTDAGVSKAVESPLPPRETLTGGRRHKTRKHKKTRRTRKSRR